MTLPIHKASCSFFLLGKVKTKQQQQQQNKTPQSLFWVVELEVCPGVWFIHSVTIPFKKTDFPSLSSYQGQIASWLEWDLVPIFPSPCWDFAWLELLHADTISQSSYVQQLHRTWKMFPWSHSPPLVLTIFLPPLLHRSPILEVRNVLKTSHLELTAPKSLTFCTLSCCEFLC